MSDAGDVLRNPPGGQQENAPGFAYTSNPVPGDLVLFFFKSWPGPSHHVGIFIGNNQPGLFTD